MNKRLTNNMLKYQRQALKTKQIKTNFSNSSNSLSNIPNAPWFNKNNLSRISEPFSHEVGIDEKEFQRVKKDFNSLESQVSSTKNLAKQERTINEDNDLAHCSLHEEKIKDTNNDTNLLKRPLECLTALDPCSKLYPSKKHKENFDDTLPDTKLQNSKLITLTIVDQILKTYNITSTSNDINLYRTAMTHKSSIQFNSVSQLEVNNDTSIGESIESKKKLFTYDRLEWLGDSTIHDILSEYIYLRYKQSEGFMTQLRSKIENTETLSILCQVLGLDAYIQKNNKCISSEGCKKMFADVFEAFIAAMRFDLGLETTKQFLTNVIEKEIDFSELLNTETNYKNRLMQYCHKMRWSDPVYSVLKEKVDGKNFTMMVSSTAKRDTKEANCNNYVIKGIGIGHSKKIGEQQAAKDALMNLGIFV